MQHIYVSPHSDDVALSCSGRIIADAARGDKSIVLNIFSSDSTGSGDDGLASKFIDSVNSRRTLEDREAWASWKIEVHDANIPEALLRGRFPFSIGRQRIDAELQIKLRDVICDYIKKYPKSCIYFPAGIGGHVDHLACRDIAFHLLEQGNIDKIFLYEDVPYSWLMFIRRQYYSLLARYVYLDDRSRFTTLRSDGLGVSEYLFGGAVPFPRGKKLFLLVYLSNYLNNAVNNRTKKVLPYKGEVRIFGLAARDVARKIELLYKYRSQIPMLFGGNPDQTLDANRHSLSSEVTIEVTRNWSDA